MNNLGTVYLFTNRCILRRFEISDAYGVFNSYASNYKICEFLNNDVHKNIYETEMMIYESLKLYNNFNYYNWIIVDQINNRVIGTTSLHNIDQYNDKVEIGIIISEKYQKKGYGKEVVSCLINFAFNKLHVHRIEAKVMVENKASNFLFSSLGFKNEGIIHSVIKKNNQFYDINQYFLLNI